MVIVVEPSKDLTVSALFVILSTRYCHTFQTVFISEGLWGSKRIQLRLPCVELDWWAGEKE